MPVDLARRLRESCRAVWNMYGPTETTVWSTIARGHRRGRSAASTSPIGRPIAGMIHRVVDATGELAPSACQASC